MARPALLITWLMTIFLHLTRTGSIALPHTDATLQAECQRVMANCQPGDPCLLPDPFSCHKYIVCTETGYAAQYRPLVMPCAFGTMWRSAPGIGAGCDNAELIDCPSDPCKTPGTSSYAHDDANCRTYWTCQNGRSKPQCCRKYQRFDPAQGTCVTDATCSDHCPLINDATCSGPGVGAIALPDGNCRTYYDCQAGKPRPVCCQDGYAYDVITSSCVLDANCVDACPGYKNLCASGNIQSYELYDKNCRTYMKCLSNGDEERFCCASGQTYNSVQNTCVATEEKTCMRQGCPFGFKEACRLEVVADPTKYKNMDAFGGTIMSCPVGTVFDQVNCNCRADPQFLQKLRQQPPGCRAAIHVKLPPLKNHGAVFAAVMRLGSYGQGESGVGNMTTFWDGNHGINIPHFGEQSLENMLIQITFKPASATPTKQVLFSSCSYLGGALDSPTLEVSLQQADAQGGELKTKLRSSLTNSFELGLRYKVDTWYTYSLVYDGTKVGIKCIIHPGDKGTKPPAAKVNVGDFTGSIKIFRSGLRFSKCRYERDVSGFVGNVADISVAKCLTPESRSILQPAAIAAAPAT